MTTENPPATTPDPAAAGPSADLPTEPGHRYAVEQLLAYVADAAVDWDRGRRPDEYVVSLPGDRKLKTVVSLVIGPSVTSIVAFVIRKPDENHAAFYRFLLLRNLKLPGIAYGLDKLGDVYVTGSVPTRAVDQAYLDQIFGVVLEAADSPFNDLLLLGFKTAMKREWDWRILRGESLANLEAFRGQLEGEPADEGHSQSAPQTLGRQPTDE